jgi:predicted enzyme related to lactoylglutathione lyase
MRIEITLDCVDLDVTAAFWRAALGYRTEGVIEGRFVALGGAGPALTLQRVAEPKTSKNRMHLDLLVADADAEVARLQALGATPRTPIARTEFGQRWFVMADPDGNEFCVADDPGSEPADLGNTSYGLHCWTDHDRRIGSP